MAFSYEKLWRTLADRHLTAADLRKSAGISRDTMARLRHDQPVTLSVLEKICAALRCNYGDIIDHVPESGETERARPPENVQKPESPQKGEPSRKPVPAGGGISEEPVRFCDAKLLNILLFDRTTKKNILWGTSDYSAYGAEFGELCEIKPELVTGRYADLIRPRVSKPRDAREGRTRKKAEVFTPAWVCNAQNNMVDHAWFGRENVFNAEGEKTWTATPRPVSFAGLKKSWKDYADARRLEIACGEAPYLVSRYDSVTGAKIPLKERVGLLDRKMRVVGENADTPEEWLKWAQRAFESVYGFEYQGDSLFLARENLLCSYVEYYEERFLKTPGIELQRQIARVISWNIWQMDGLKGVVPGSRVPAEDRQLSLFEPDAEDGPTGTGRADRRRGIAGGNVGDRAGIYCRIMDWRSKRSLTFVSLLKGGRL